MSRYDELCNSLYRDSRGKELVNTDRVLVKLLWDKGSINSTIIQWMRGKGIPYLYHYQRLVALIGGQWYGFHTEVGKTAEGDMCTVYLCAFQ